MTSSYAPPAPRFTTPSQEISNLTGCAPALLIYNAIRHFSGWHLIVTRDSYQAARLIGELSYFLEGGEIPLLQFPDWETLPYDHFSPHQDIISDRIKTLYQLRHRPEGVLVVPTPTLIQKLPPVSYLSREALFIKPGDRIDLSLMRLQLEESGYRNVSEVNERGEFAVRGALLDLFPTGSDLPYRIDFFDDEVESLRQFDPETQRTLHRIDAIELLPAREFPLNEESITLFRQQFRAAFSNQDPRRALIYQEISDHRTPNGIEYYLPLFYDSPLDSLMAYTPPKTRLLLYKDAFEGVKQAWEDVHTRYEQLRYDQERPILPPERLYLSPEQTQQAWAQFPTLILELTASSASEEESPTVSEFGFSSLRFTPTSSSTPEGIESLASELRTLKGQSLICASSAGRQEHLIELFASQQISLARLPHWTPFTPLPQSHAITVFPLEKGVTWQGSGLEPIHLLAEGDLFGVVPHQARKRRDTRDPETILRNLTDLQVGSPVVHIEHGIGQFMGLVTLDVEGVANEFIALEYAQGDKLYVPVSSLHLISRYSSSGHASPTLHRLGSRAWEKVRAKARERVRDVAAELLEIYARRASKSGFAIPFDPIEYQRFAASFPFAETPDQEATIDAVIEDMRSEVPMDRIVCGDVGFGKTEVALRAAFVAVHAGRQVALLVPTTLLAQQHATNFRDRFAQWACRVEVLSRFEKGKTQKQLLEELEGGQIDIIIGTHRLLQKDIRFKRLGLLIIDEEHRFGVSQKEKIKSLKSEVDILTLTATPIPRTLNLALGGLRDLSIIATPPPRRLSVKTRVSEWSNGVIREACLREIKRGGQIYFLHNEVRSIERMQAELSELLPEASIRFAHGQMREQELEQVMLDFYHQRFNLLLCTTIIESGIDIPTANTIIINRADKLGLAQLHQLRGRVGRSHHRAYAILLTPHPKSMTRDAVRRLEAIASLEDLGAGFLLANQDLEIRGAGEFLGDEQSGHIHEVGYTLFMEMLEKAVEDLRQGKESLPDDLLIGDAPEVDLGLPAILPEDYLPDIPSRLILYKRIANASTQEELDELQIEMIDRFGLLPEQSKYLFAIARIRIRATQMGLQRIEAGAKGATLTFREKPHLRVDKMIELIQYQPQRYQLLGNEKLRLLDDLSEPKVRLEALESLFDLLALPTAQ